MARRQTGSSDNLPANIDAELAKEAATISDTLNSSGGAFIKLDGRTGNFKHSVLGEAEPPMELVVVDYRAQNQYFSSGYDPDNIVPPDCWSIAKNVADLAPSDQVPDPVNDKCKGCPMNEFKTAHNGKGKACKNTYYLAVLPPECNPDDEIAYMRLSPTAMKSFESFVNGVSARFKTPPLGAIVTVGSKPAGSSYAFDFGTYRKNPKYKEAFMRRPEVQAMLEQEWTPLEEDEKPAAKPAPRRAPARKKAATRRR